MKFISDLLLLLLFRSDDLGVLSPAFLRYHGMPCGLTSTTLQQPNSGFLD